MYFNPEDLNEGEYKLGNPYVLETLSDGTKRRNEHWYIVYAPGYDTTIATPIRNTIVFAGFTSYFHGMFTPMVVAAFLPRYEPEIADAGDVFDWKTFEDGSGFVSTAAKFVFGNHWRIGRQLQLHFRSGPLLRSRLFPRPRRGRREGSHPVLTAGFGGTHEKF
ncbi:MAG: hypothetical protein M5R36_20405 [Deltaproteobacteria bacterium]|nr:hypothetical protein [Deltaproteobacteria bacterium]